MPHPTIDFPAGSSRQGRRGSRTMLAFCLLLVLTALVRLLWILLLPIGEYSVDLAAWRQVAASLQVGVDPYAQFGVLNWPPFWMEMLFAIARFASRFHLDSPDDFLLCVRGVVMVGDLAVLSATYGLMRLSRPRAPFFLVLLVGYCLNPLLTILTVQHGNFDVFAVFWIMLFLRFLVKYQRGQDLMDWLLAAACLGIGVFTKTFPLVLWPLLAAGAAATKWRARILAAALVIAPAALSLAPLYVIDTAAITRNVLAYRSFGSNFGVLSLLTLADARTIIPLYGRLFTPIYLTASVILAIYLWRRGSRPADDYVLLAAILLLATFTLGPGYGTQYWFWVFPPLIVVYSQHPGRFRGVLLAAGIIACVTNGFEYAVAPNLGRFWYGRPGSSYLYALAQVTLTTETQSSIWRLPLTLASIAILVWGSRQWIDRRPRADEKNGPAGSFTQQ